MRMRSVRIENFRAFKDETITFDDYTSLLGANGCGKSTILTALNIFFRETNDSSTDLLKLTEEDFNNKNISEPVKITVTFSDLEPKAQEDFADYVRQDKLLVFAKAEFDSNTGEAEVKHYGQRLGMSEFRRFFEALKAGEKVPGLKSIYNELQEKHSDLPNPSSKQQMIDALQDYESSHKDLCKPIDSEDQFYGVSRGANRLARYIQWIYVPAVKDATTEQLEGKNTALGKLLARTVRSKTNFTSDIETLRNQARDEYQTILDQNQTILDAISKSLQTRLAEWAHPEASLRVKWQEDSKGSVQISEPLAGIIAGEGVFEGQLGRFGHGLQRSYLLALLQELATSDDEMAPKLILACEEPELYQHPPQARHMAAILRRLSEEGSQVIICTHSPYFVSGQHFEDVRLVQKQADSSCANVTQVTTEELASRIATARGEQILQPNATLAKIHQALQPTLNEIFFTPVLILVEGIEDVAHITTYLNILNQWDEFRRLGCHIVQTDGKSHMIQPFAITSMFEIPTLVVFDTDAQLEDRNGSQEKHRKDNLALLTISGLENPDPLPQDTIWSDNVIAWKSNMTEVVAGDFPSEEWGRIQEECRVAFGHAPDLKKNALFIAQTLKAAWDQGLRSPNLERACETILTFARNRKFEAQGV